MIHCIVHTVGFERIDKFQQVYVRGDTDFLIDQLSRLLCMPKDFAEKIYNGITVMTILTDSFPTAHLDDQVPTSLSWVLSRAVNLYFNELEKYDV